MWAAAAHNAPEWSSQPDVPRPSVYHVAGGPIQLALFAAVIVATGWIAWTVLRQGHRAELTRRAAKKIEGEFDARLGDALVSAGGRPDHPIEVVSAAAIEPRAESEACWLCGGRAHVSEHVALPEGTRATRQVTTKCGRCGNLRAVYFAIVVGPN